MKILLGALLVLFSVNSFAYTHGQIQPALYDSALRTLIDQQDKDGEHLLRIAKATYSFSVNGGASGSEMNLGQYLPANATVIRAYGYVNTAIAPSGTKIAFSCGGATLLTATDETGVSAGGYFDGAATGAASAFADTGTVSSYGERCQIQSEITIHPATAGLVNFYILYTVHP